MRIFQPLKYIPLLLFIALVSFSPTEKDITPYKLIFFEGSDWCINCIRFEKKVLSTDVFIDFAESNEIDIERIDFPQRRALDEVTRRYNESIAEKYQFTGVFPTILLVNTETEEVQEIVYRNQDLDAFLSLIRSKIEVLK